MIDNEACNLVVTTKKVCKCLNFPLFERGRQGDYVDLCRGVWRIQGSLAVSRGIGDRHLKQWVTAEPETKVLRIEPEHDLLILASDGLWDKV